MSEADRNFKGPFQTFGRVGDAKRGDPAALQRWRRSVGDERRAEFSRCPANALVRGSIDVVFRTVGHENQMGAGGFCVARDRGEIETEVDVLSQLELKLFGRFFGAGIDCSLAEFL